MTCLPDEPAAKGEKPFQVEEAKPAKGNEYCADNQRNENLGQPDNLHKQYVEGDVSKADEVEDGQYWQADANDGETDPKKYRSRKSSFFPRQRAFQ